MPEFYDVYGYNDDTPSKEFDRIAVEEAGRLACGGGQYACPKAKEIIPQAPEWGTIVINTGGMGNSGTIVLKGRTPRTKALLHEGKKRRLIANGVAIDVAEIAATAKYGNEVEVAILAEKLVEATRVNGEFKGDSHLKFSEWAEGIKIAPMSFPRKYAAAKIAAEALKREIKKFSHAG